ncbi:DUF167 domain-containing protein [Maritalea mediterranea]|uniref:UPF0235 protein L1I42_15740 n=1 Tax=Maritalea mediterranea TaxID=2909667 RepID=A0ABS9EAN5_9HYPH|nr:DUF167 family protein [Maritalea mediterranea]MCF4099949.1 DUF167 family protein [Maritalea mediterranea]
MPEADLKAWRNTNAGLLLFLKVTPNASRDEIGDIVADADGQGQLVVRVRAVPEKGKANKAVIRLLAKRLRCRAADLELIRGEVSRQKQVQIFNLREEELLARLF